jgi:crotonobetainyl-CoA hydratase
VAVNEQQYSSPGPASGSTADGPAVLVERVGHVLIATINRPQARNAVNLAVARGLGDVLDEADHDRDVRVVVVTGAGDKAFCAGADLKAVSRGESISPDEPHRVAWGFAGYVSHHISKPTIAAVNGFALGGGTEIALASDLIVAAETASFGLPEVKRGIVAAAGGAFRLPQQIPIKQAMQLILTGEPITARRAQQLNLVNDVVEPGRLLDAALELAGRISVNAPLAVQASKRIARRVVDGQVELDQAAWELTRAEISALMQTADAKEGPLAFAEKRTPRWEGR